MSVKTPYRRTKVNQENKPKRRCRAMEILGFRSESCDGWIHNENIQICEHCQKVRDGRNINHDWIYYGAD